MPKHLFDLSGRVAMVTGASRGLGQYMSRALARAGADLVITSRDASRLEAFERELRAAGTRVVPVALEVQSRQSISSMVREVERRCGRVDILVNNAGCNIRKPALEVSPEDWSTIVDTNLRGAFFVAQAVAPLMIRAGYGRIINIGSVTCVAGYAGFGPYCASRGGIKQLTMSLACDWGPFGVTVNCLAPGWFRTAQNAALYENPHFVSSLEERTPVGRPGEPTDLDGAVVFLASESSRYVTGQTLLVDGGFSTGAIRTGVAATDANPARSNTAA